MRFDSTLYYHVGEDYSWPVLFDEMHETVGLLAALTQETFSHHGEFHRFPATGWVDIPWCTTPASTTRTVSW